MQFRLISIQEKRSVYIRCPASSLLVSGTQASQHYRECSVPDYTGIRRLDESLPLQISRKILYIDSTATEQEGSSVSSNA